MAKQNTVELLKSLIILTQSLSPLPAVRYVSMKLWYDEGVPDEYEPHLFRPATEIEDLRFAEVPLECSIGKVETGHHGLSIRIKTLADQELQAQLEESQGSPSFSQAEIFKNGELSMSQFSTADIISEHTKAVSVLPISSSTQGMRIVAISSDKENTDKNDAEVHDEAEKLYRKAVAFTVQKDVLTEKSLKNYIGVDGEVLAALVERLAEDKIISKRVSKLGGGWRVNIMENSTVQSKEIVVKGKTINTGLSPKVAIGSGGETKTVPLTRKRSKELSQEVPNKQLRSSFSGHVECPAKTAGKRRKI